jgi:hypothetical protein
MAIDYTSTANVKAYGGSTVPGADSIIGSAVTAVSRAIDRMCFQAFSQESYTRQRLRGAVTVDGVLICTPPVPTITALTAARWKPQAATEWQDLDVTTTDYVEWDDSDSGAIVRFPGANLVAYRGTPITVQLTYTGGWADLNAVPADLEWAARRWAWLEVKRRDAPIEKTAVPELGVLIVPSDLPPDVVSKLQPFRRTVLL